ncbi:hypothetical protein PR048_015366 [Dryococelus australis]|uniref:DUF4817 domain-containing protein n=1 Tax=Dryococelus australis TaxID=614101 RepID=A0ABQ9HH07_9NEOP|nr:hypothetical protein PR048_015366 [Dryococelus australis]
MQFSPRGISEFIFRNCIGWMLLVIRTEHHEKIYPLNAVGWGRTRNLQKERDAPSRDESRLRRVVFAFFPRNAWCFNEKENDISFLKHEGGRPDPELPENDYKIVLLPNIEHSCLTVLDNPTGGWFIVSEPAYLIVKLFGCLQKWVLNADIKFKTSLPLRILQAASFNHALEAVDLYSSCKYTTRRGSSWREGRLPIAAQHQSPISVVVSSVSVCGSAYTMKFTNEKKLEALFMYGDCGRSAKQTAQMYDERYPYRVPIPRQTIRRICTRLLSQGDWNSPTRVRRNSAMGETQHDVLSRIDATQCGYARTFQVETRADPSPHPCSFLIHLFAGLISIWSAFDEVLSHNRVDSDKLDIFRVLATDADKFLHGDSTLVIWRVASDEENFDSQDSDNPNKGFHLQTIDNELEEQRVVPQVTSGRKICDCQHQSSEECDWQAGLLDCMLHCAMLHESLRCEMIVTAQQSTRSCELRSDRQTKARNTWPAPRAVSSPPTFDDTWGSIGQHTRARAGRARHGAKLKWARPGAWRFFFCAVCSQPNNWGTFPILGRSDNTHGFKEHNMHASLIAVAQTYCEKVKRSSERFQTNPARQAECAEYYGWKRGEQGLCSRDTASARRPESSAYGIMDKADDHYSSCHYNWLSLIYPHDVHRLPIRGEVNENCPLSRTSSWSVMLVGILNTSAGMASANFIRAWLDPRVVWESRGELNEQQREAAEKLYRLKIPGSRPLRALDLPDNHYLPTSVPPGAAVAKIVPLSKIIRLLKLTHGDTAIQATIPHATSGLFALKPRKALNLRAVLPLIYICFNTRKRANIEFAENVPGLQTLQESAYLFARISSAWNGSFGKNERACFHMATHEVQRLSPAAKCFIRRIQTLRIDSKLENDVFYDWGNSLPLSSVVFNSVVLRQIVSEEIWAALNSEVFEPVRVIEVNMERRRNERAGVIGDLRENPPTNGIVQHDSHLRKSGEQYARLQRNLFVALRLQETRSLKSDIAFVSRWTPSIIVCKSAGQLRIICITPRCFSWGKHARQLRRGDGNTSRPSHLSHSAIGKSPDADTTARDDLAGPAGCTQNSPVVECEEGSEMAVDSTQVASIAVTNPLPFSHAVTLASANDLYPVYHKARCLVSPKHALNMEYSLFSRLYRQRCDETFNHTGGVSPEAHHHASCTRTGDTSCSPMGTSVVLLCNGIGYAAQKKKKAEPHWHIDGLSPSLQQSRNEGRE